MKKTISQCFERWELFSFFKVSLFSLLTISMFYQGFNIYHIERLHNEIISNYSQLYSISRRFSTYYNNTDTIPLTKGLHKRNNVSIIVSKDTNVKVLSTGINKLKSELKNIIPNSLWTIAVFENPAYYSHYDPLRPSYQSFFDSYDLNSVMTRIVKKEKLSKSYQNFYGCNLKITDSYTEQETGERIRTIYYPVFNNKKLNSLLAIDIKEEHIKNMINRYNLKHHTTINNGQSNNVYHSTSLLPCSDSSPITIGISYIDVLEKSFIPSVFVSVLITIMSLIAKQRDQSFKRDRMTNFYRRDYYESRLKKMRSFSMLIIDIDHFKTVNDTYGHKKGDEVITQITRIINQQIRNDDIAIRWGGEEFIIIFQNMTPTVLQEKAECIRESIAKNKIAGLSVTISIGGIHSTNTTFSNAYKHADSALYESKHRGRDKVTIA
ncbi:diguanylate cyclase [Photobacterium aquae]|uniref:diguanylate cyclase n=1 Tax=Photobacterium aquae TaxID=1195763 RepID=A0A0J1JXD8_9GAMM|nr:GGDEF domain-containing protein [Photobacterium aquae]KLV06957.1 diguanylate cyclase [Photobacterium aquae]